MPTFAAKYALLVVVAPPEIVIPPFCAPFPMVLDAIIICPVDVELKLDPSVNG
jgi:hypothetical protein